MIHKSAMEVSEEKRKATFEVLGKGGIYVITGNFGSSNADICSPGNSLLPYLRKAAS